MKITCSKCKLKKEISYFSKRNNTQKRSGFSSWCNDCVNSKDKANYRNKLLSSGDDVIECKVCNRLFKSITNSHLKLHNLTHKQYKELYPQAELKTKQSSNKSGRALSKTGQSLSDLIQLIKKEPLGQVPDSLIADKYHLSTRAICRVRNELKIKPFVGIILSQEGRPLRSLDEAKYDAYLHWKGISHKHDVKIDGCNCVADFVLNDNSLIEIAGMIGYHKYDKKHKEKIKIYNSLNTKVTWLFKKDVDALFKDCPIDLRFKSKRFCKKCDKETYDLVKLHCRKCYNAYWGEKNKSKIEKTCRTCKKQFFPDGRQKNQKFCSHDCYADNIRGDWPSWGTIFKELETKSVLELAKELGKKPNALYMKIKRYKEKQT